MRAGLEQAARGDFADLTPEESEHYLQTGELPARARHWLDSAPFPCNVDSDCQLIDGAAPAKPMVCGQPGGCVSGQSCIPGCQSDSDCSGGDSVCRSGHCVAKPCQVDSDCPSIDIYDFVCSGNSGTRVCTYEGCANDSDCHRGFCVNQTCSSQQGFCASSAL